MHLFAIRKAASLLIKLIDGLFREAMTFFPSEIRWTKVRVRLRMSAAK